MSDLITFNEFLAATGKQASDLSAPQTARVNWAIGVASEAVRQYTDRDLTINTDAVQGARTYRYYGHGVLEIDDCTAISQVATAATPWNPSTRVLDPTEYISGSTSANLPVCDYLELWTNLPFATNPVMGFKENQDMYGWRPHPVELAVTANWGWPSIPTGIKQAVVWTIGEVLTDIDPYVSESIEGYSHSRAQRMSSGGGDGQGSGVSPTTGMAIPERAQALLSSYLRVNV